MSFLCPCPDGHTPCGWRSEQFSPSEKVVVFHVVSLLFRPWIPVHLGHLAVSPRVSSQGELILCRTRLNLSLLRGRPSWVSDRLFVGSRDFSHLPIRSLFRNGSSFTFLPAALFGSFQLSPPSCPRRFQEGRDPRTKTRGQTLAWNKPVSYLAWCLDQLLVWPFSSLGPSDSFHLSSPARIFRRLGMVPPAADPEGEDPDSPTEFEGLITISPAGRTTLHPLPVEPELPTPDVSFTESSGVF